MHKGKRVNGKWKRKELKLLLPPGPVNARCATQRRLAAIAVTFVSLRPTKVDVVRFARVCSHVSAVLDTHSSIDAAEYGTNVRYVHCGLATASESLQCPTFLHSKHTSRGVNDTSKNVMKNGGWAGMRRHDKRDIPALAFVLLVPGLSSKPPLIYVILSTFTSIG
ncbi:hypothetical protein AcW1_003140 [Taiwanofungus camphoratus]|nr:hypothetical protein AcV5_001668 [Antrodia cinnamomea]KAI0933207.1 hypothetical protein AcV7_004743 [Antrodia cinnamomea]KAI0942539.1 hypothetical protein AcW1_003140 [Antrodia cinnamomea]